MKTKRLSRVVAASMLVATFTLSPTLTYAKQDKGNNGKSVQQKEAVEQQRKLMDDAWDNEEEHEKREKAKEQTLIRRNGRMEKECFRSFGLLIRMSRTGNKERLQELADRVCFWPFGIWKKFPDNRATTTPPQIDTVAPAISNISTNPKIVRAEVKWETNEKTRGTLYYSTTTPINITAGSIQVLSGSGFSRNHHTDIFGLTASTTYYALISTVDASGNTATSSEFSFTTKSILTDALAPIISSVSTLVGTTTISVGWHTNEFSTSKLLFGTSTPLDANASTTPFTEKLTLEKDHRLDLSGLGTSTTYYLIIESRDASGNVRRTGQFQAMTLAN
ncbi:MAG TPA: hypothetical protein DEF00_05175 [Candidatus Taylorbacteria bacterium]|nr:MAG: Fibronectin type III domain protein [Parcubacteria group bacterium GW2011_GWA2_47_64]KKU97235.1 MAG: Fibronectin type III domain protein [Parcubacteria group bacterium GW2011_GWC2_48_17]HBV01739.1 hypothetical protein [Candidatus Taylorbacteria bacterium]